MRCDWITTICRIIDFAIITKTLLQIRREKREEMEEKLDFGKCIVCNTVLDATVFYGEREETFHACTECSKCGTFWIVSKEREQEIINLFSEQQLAELESFYINKDRKVKK